MTLPVVVLGWELFSIRLGRDDVLEDDEAPDGITGGTSLYTERDMYPPAAETQAPWQEDRKTFGFR